MTGRVQPWRLEEASRRCLHGCLRRGLMLATVSLAASLAGAHDVIRTCNDLTGTFTFASLILMVIALYRHEQAGRGSLNLWDEALAFNAFALLAHLVRQAVLV